MPRPPSVSATIAALAADIRAYCAEHQNPALAAKYARYFQEGYDAWGLMDVKHPFFNQKEEEWFSRCAGRDLAFFFALGEELFRSGKYEEGSMAIRLLQRRRDELSADHLPFLLRWFECITNWAHTDGLCSELLHPHIASGRIAYVALAPWRESPYRFARRAAPEALLPLVKRGAHQEIPPLLDFVRPLMLDGERVVQQGLGWFLREAWKKDPAPVESLLMEFRNRAPRIIYQCATEKMTPEQKSRFRRDRSS